MVDQMSPLEMHPRESMEEAQGKKGHFLERWDSAGPRRSRSRVHDGRRWMPVSLGWRLLQGRLDVYNV
jgi:hypothetical protein